MFTHLGEPQQILWRDELLRVLRPDGLLLFTTQGSRFRRQLDASQQRTFDEGHIVYEGEVVASVGENRFGSYQSEAHVRNVLEGPMEVIDFKPWAAMGVGGQDLWLARKPSSTA